jgi:hypothetical protein
MTQLRVYGFTDDAGSLALKKLAEPVGGEALTVVSNGMLHALVGTEPTVWPWTDTSQRVLQQLVTYHKVLGDAAKRVDKIIPASFESVFGDTDAVHKALAQHQRDILDLLSRYGDSRQFSLSIRWDTPVMQQLMQRYGYKAGALDKERKTLRDQALLILQGCLQDIIILEQNEPDMVLQSILLVKNSDEAKLTKALQKFDQECQGRLAMRLVGPLPACNFARVELRLPDRDVVKEACRDLGIGRVTRLSEVKTAYRQRVKTLHPDRAHGDKHESMVRLTQSYRYLTRLAAQQNNGFENNPDRQWLRCDFKTLSQTPLMRIQRGLTRWDDALLRRG